MCFLFYKYLNYLKNELTKLLSPLVKDVKIPLCCGDGVIGA